MIRIFSHYVSRKLVFLVGLDALVLMLAAYVGISLHLYATVGALPTIATEATARFRAWGIPVVNDRVMVPHWVRGREEGSLVSHMNQKIVLTALGPHQS